MDKGKLSDKEAALIAAARREAAARKGESPASTPREAKPAPSAAERLAQLMESERAESQERKRKMRRWGLGLSAAILALFALWALRATRSRR